MTDARRELIFGVLGLAILAVVAVVLFMQASDGSEGSANGEDSTENPVGVTPPPLPVVTAIPTLVPTPTPTRIPQTYTVQAGDTLRNIAERFDVTVEDLASKNGIPDPNNIFAGQKLELPQPGERLDTPELEKSGADVYIVQSGDTLYAIAQDLGVSVESLAEINDITDPAQLFVGRHLNIPERQITPPTARPQA
jgi:LysM repeat protein